MQNYKELLAQKAELDKQIEQARNQESKAALATVRQLVESFGFTAQQVFPWKPETKKKAEVKYYDPESGNTWTGRGKPPKWIADKDRSQFEIKKNEDLFDAEA
ncbi:H-NS histone family protein [Comamonas composti]|uniref:H-NS histone family protein n=1 Tax=Comamonas composti TaxID=408558 RepID=UPI0004001A66|nr:H-NS histone family protein [Comamonas composti]